MSVKNWASLLFKLCQNQEGKLELNRVCAVCEYVAQNFPQDISLKILRNLKKSLSFKIEKNSALVESAGSLNPDSKLAIESFIKSKNPEAQIEFLENPKLIAGIRIKIGDSLWENSAEQKLRDLAESLGA